MSAGAILFSAAVAFLPTTPIRHSPRWRSSSICRLKAVFTDEDKSSPIKDQLAPIIDEHDAALDTTADDEDDPSIAMYEPSDRSTILGALATCSLVVTFLLYTLRFTPNMSDTFLLLELPEKLIVLARDVEWLPHRVQSAEFMVAVVMGVSAFAQALTGFGFAVVSVGALSSMPWIYHSDLFEVITPVAATLGAVTGCLLLLPSVRNLRWSEILPLLVPCTLLTPVGIGLKSLVDPDLATRVLATLVLAFVAYEVWLMANEEGGGSTDDAASAGEEDGHAGAASGAAAEGAPEPFLRSPKGALALGSLAGIFGGAFDVQGPPLVLYGTSNEWTPSQFRDNILTVVAVNSASVVLLDYFVQPELLQNFYYPYFCLTSLPFVVVGVAAGQWASERIDPAVFGKLVLFLCFALGVQLLTLS